MRLARMSGGSRLAAAKRSSVGSPSALAKAETSRSGGGFSRSRSIRDRSAMDTSTRRASSVSVMSRPSRSRRMYFPKAIRSPMALWRGVNTSNDGLLGV